MLFYRVTFMFEPTMKSIPKATCSNDPKPAMTDRNSNSRTPLSVKVAFACLLFLGANTLFGLTVLLLSTPSTSYHEHIRWLAAGAACLLVAVLVVWLRASWTWWTALALNVVMLSTNWVNVLVQIVCFWALFSKSSRDHFFNSRRLNATQHIHQIFLCIAGSLVMLSGCGPTAVEMKIIASKDRIVLGEALREYRRDVGRYPSSEQGLRPLLTACGKEGWRDHISKLSHESRIRGRIADVNQEWGFIVLDVGSNHGVTNDMVFVVGPRGNAKGRLRVKQTSENSSVAYKMERWYHHKNLNEGDVVVESHGGGGVSFSALMKPMPASPARRDEPPDGAPTGSRQSP